MSLKILVESTCGFTDYAMMVYLVAALSVFSLAFGCLLSQAENVATKQIAKVLTVDSLIIFII